MKKLVNCMLISILLMLILASVSCILGSTVFTVLFVCIGLIMVILTDYTDKQCKRLYRYASLRMKILSGMDVGYTLEELDLELTGYQRFLYKIFYKKD